MIKKIIEIIGDMLTYIFNIKLFDLPYLFAQLLVMIMVGYCVSAMLIYFPCSIYKEITKKKINEEAVSNAVTIVTICFVVILWIRLLYELSSK